MPGSAFQPAGQTESPYAMIRVSISTFRKLDIQVSTSICRISGLESNVFIANSRKSDIRTPASNCRASRCEGEFFDFQLPEARRRNANSQLPRIEIRRQGGICQFPEAEPPTSNSRKSILRSRARRVPLDWGTLPD